MTFYYIGMYEIITYIHVYPINILSRFKVLGIQNRCDR